MTLIICEKNNAAKRIAHILSGGKARSNSKFKRPYYSYEEKGEKFDIIGLRGHIVALDYPEEYNSWRKVKPKDLVSIDPILVDKEKSIIRALRWLSKNHNETIIATDFDREGELIGKEALDVIMDANSGMKERRVHFSSLTRNEIISAFEKPLDMDWNLVDAAFTRQYVDLVWGVTLTRFISLTSGKVGQDFLSVGRVQTPTLSLLVEKEAEIEAFKSQKYWVIKALLNKGVDFQAKHKKGHFKKEEDMKRVMEQVKDAKQARVMNLRFTKSNRYPPSPFSTTLFLKDATKLGMSAAEAMAIAEDLYTRGYISYPRTDNTVYPKGIDIRDILGKFSSHKEYGEYVKELLAKNDLRPSRGKKQTTDHPPIYPTKCVTPEKLEKKQQKIYDLVVRRFLATLGDKCILEKGNIEFDIKTEPFISKSLRVVQPGWTKYYRFNGIRTSNVPELEKDEMVTIKEIESKEKETKPPARYNQGNLIGEMEKLGLGTKSTRHSIIQKLIQRNFLNSNPLKPTESGKALISTMSKYSEPITRSEMTSQLEEDMLKIAEGKMDWVKVSEESQKMLMDIFKVLEENVTLIRNNLREALKDQNTLGECPQCQGKMLIRRSRRGKRFAGCSSYPQCKNTYPLPQYGGIRPKEEKCSVCGSPVVNIIKKGKKPWEICINMGCEYNKNEG